MWKKLGSWFMISAAFLLFVILVMCSGIKNTLEEEKQNELRKKMLQRQEETRNED